MSGERAEQFGRVYQRKLWASHGVLSGEGSRAENCVPLIEWLDGCAADGMRTVLDLGCGDLEWISRCQAVPSGLMRYEGWDVVPSLIGHHRRVFPWFRGKAVDIEALPRISADVVILKDVLLHMCTGGAEQVLQNLARGSWRRLLVSSYPGATNGTRRGLRKAGAWAAYDVEASGILSPGPADRLPRPEGGVNLIFHR